MPPPAAPKSELAKKWISTILGTAMIVTDVILFTRHVWHGHNQQMGLWEWAGSAVMLSAGMLLLGYKFRVADYLPGRWFRP